jgi:hypothetical protein
MEEAGKRAKNDDGLFNPTFEELELFNIASGIPRQRVSKK